MAAEQTDVQSLLALAREKSEQARSHLFEVMGDMFMDQARILTTQERSLMVDILEKLITEVSHDIRTRLSQRVASAANLPRELAVLLANDDIDVAAPILMQCAALQQIDLIEVIHQRSRQHMLAIAMRRDLSLQVSDALVDSGDVDVIRTLLENHDAQISAATLAYIVEQSKTIDDFQGPLVRRHDLPRELAVKMCYWVSAALRLFILDKFHVDANELDELIEPALQAEVKHTQEDTTDPSDAAMLLARELHRKGQLTSKIIIQALRRGEVALFEAMMSELAQLRIPLVRRLLYEGGGEGLAITARSVGLLREEFATIFLLSRKTRPGVTTTDPTSLGSALSFFDKLNPENARQVISRWQRDPNYLFAIMQVEDSTRPTNSGPPSTVPPSPVPPSAPSPAGPPSTPVPRLRHANSRD
ncbi:MAG TPA: DUF2336 domain-containing protein [Terriglobales bacterium]|nr:DUF2336 domain-containing protein [Terriglobales bacterium]